MSFPLVAEVIVDRHIRKRLDYGITPSQQSRAKTGVQVKVMLRGRLCMGTIFEIKEQSKCKKLLPVHEILSDKEVLPKDLFDLALWMSRYYCTELSRVIRILLPSSVRNNHSHKTQIAVIPAKPKKTLRELSKTLRQTHPPQAKVLDVILMAKNEVLLTEILEKAKVSKSPVSTLVKKGVLFERPILLDRSSLIGEQYFKTEKKKLNPEQQKGLDAILEPLENQSFETFLLWGVTGSGKTEIYLQAIEKALELGKGTILLVPEITLTAQTIQKFKNRFHEKIAVLHHRLSPGERLDTWTKIRNGEVKIVVGARSALFSPVQNLGLIIVDEEHDGAYKQSEKAPLYHARDVAVMRGKIAKSVVVLGTATPNLESFTNALECKYKLIHLSVRVAKAKLPKVTIVDMKEAFQKAKGFTPFSDALIEGIKKKHALGEQVILFLNRRGTHSSQMCQDCGHVITCPSCDLSLTFHKKEKLLLCHLCNYTLSPPPKTCPKCLSSETFKFKGIGTELVERSLKALLPEVRVLRIDGDTTRHKGSHERLFGLFATGKADVLVGTQMIAKGLHFPSVTLVAILNTDSALHIPDFRASETVFSLITQVAGRAGRGQLPGEVLIQTHLPKHSTILHAAKQDFAAFYKEEIESRKYFNYPPFSRIVKFTFSSTDANRALREGISWRKKLLAKLPKAFSIHPLTPAGHAKINNRFRFHFLARGPGVYPISDAAFTLLQYEPLPRTVSLTVDVDPLSTFF